MTKINIKNNKTRIVTTVTAALMIGLVLLSPLTVLPNVGATIQNPTSLAQITDSYLLSTTPSKLSENEKTQYDGIILNDNEVKAAIDGKPYQFGSVGFIGNVYHPSSGWYPEIHITVEEKSNFYKDVAVVVDPTTKSIRKIQIMNYSANDRNTGGSNHSWSVQRFGGNSGTPDGVLENMTAISFTSDGNNRNGVGNVNLLNALMLGSNWNNACVKGSTPSTYWAQIGFRWESSGSIIWADTNSGTNGCGTNFVTSPAYVPGKTYQFRIVGATSGWAYYAIRADTGDTFTTRGPTVNSDQMSVSSTNDGTSDFFENKYLSTDPSWYGQYGSSPGAYHAQYKTTTFGSYSNWGSVTESDEDCNGVNHYYPYDSTKQVMTGTLSSGATALWSMLKMQTYYPAC